MAALEVLEHDILDSSKPLEEKQAPVITPNQGAQDNVSTAEMDELRDIAELLKETVVTNPAHAREVVVQLTGEKRLGRSGKQQAVMVAVTN